MGLSGYVVIAVMVGFAIGYICARFMGGPSRDERGRFTK